MPAHTDGSPKDAGTDATNSSSRATTIDGIPQPKAIYGYLTGHRSMFIDYAEDAAKMTLPQLSPRGTRIEERPYTSEGTSAVRSLGSATMKITMPPGVQWAKLDLPTWAWNALISLAQEGKVPAEKIIELKNRLDQRTQDIMRSLEQKNTRSRLAAAMLRNLVEGSTAINVTPLGLRIFPLRSHAVQRDEFGAVKLLACMEVADMDLARANDKTFSDTTNIWTLIDFERNEIWRQVGDDEGTIPFQVEGEDAVQWIVFVSEIPDVDHYPTSFVWNYLRLIKQLDHEEQSLGEAMADAAWTPVGIREGSTLSDDPNQVLNTKTGEPIIMQEGDIFYPDKKSKLNDWAFVATMRQADKEELAALFAKGIKDRPIGNDTSATAVIQMIDELNSQTQDLLSAYEDTLQRPLIMAENSILEARDPLFAEEESVLKSLLKVTVTTGVNALDKQRQLMRFAVQVLPQLQAMDQTFQVHAVEIADRFSDSLLLNTEGMYSQMQLPEGAGGAGGPAGLTPGAGLPREETIMTRGGPQPPQPNQPGNTR